MGMVNERDKLTRHVLDVAYQALTKGTPYGQYLTLVGAHSIYKQLNAQFKGFDEDSRTTEDLDFDLYNISLTEEDYVLFQTLYQDSSKVYNLLFPSELYGYPNSKT